MSKVLIKFPRILEDRESGVYKRLGKFEKHLVKDPSKVFSDSYSTIPVAELSGAPHRFTFSKDDYLTLDADFLDEYKSLKRLAQIITLKDIGRIITLLGLTRDSVVVEAGSGSGAATKYFANIVKEVHSYENNKEHLAVAKENCADCANVTFYEQDIYQEAEVGTHHADGFLLDVPQPELAIMSVSKALRTGGRVVVYTPNLTQAQRMMGVLGEEWLNEGTTQLTETDWRITDKILRPSMQGLGHTAFLTVLRKLPPEKNATTLAH